MNQIHKPPFAKLPRVLMVVAGVVTVLISIVAMAQLLKPQQPALYQPALARKLTQEERWKLDFDMVNEITMRDHNNYRFDAPGSFEKRAMVFADLFTNNTFEADGTYKANAAGGIDVRLGNCRGGAGDLYVNTMQSLLDQTYKQAAETSKLYGTPMGVIAERLPHITLEPGVMFLWITDPVTGNESIRTFDLQGNYLAPGSVEGQNSEKANYYQNSSCLRRRYLGYNAKTYLKAASNDDFWRVVA